MSERTTAEDRSIRVSDAVHQRLLTIQYKRKMARESVSFNEIIEQLLDIREGWQQEARGRT